MDPAPGGHFFYDFASPDCYLAAERVVAEHGSLVEWTPVVADLIPGCASPAAFRCAEDVAAFRESFEVRARDAGLQAVRWPADWPFDSELCALAGHYTAAIGRSIAFSLAAFRQAYAAGRDLSELDSLYRVLSFIAVGIVLLVGAYAYQRVRTAGAQA